ncbi:MAG: D-glycerate dehydrogenase [Pseudopedobacter saltans]|uniref:Glyoxylate/hydroxypyruvate reductase B n=1 Tax=Pseudopedobacter saltans TaxID=151895 RepID=A0A2W5GZE8_9SPHI|nr:MAG: D-glycerate dehydrogenase [Pseudopedobacter saltans]
MKVFITKPIGERGMAVLEKAKLDITIWKQKKALSQDELIQKLQSFDAFICIGKYKLNEDFFSKCSHLKAVSLLSVGYDNVDVEAAKKWKVPVGNTPGVLSVATADTAFLLMQMVARKAIFNYRTIVEDQGVWGNSNPMDNLGIDLEGKTLGVFGLGRIGFEMAKKCQQAFGMKIVYHNRSKNEEAESVLGAKKVTFEKLLQTSDVISIHSALTPETKKVFDKAAFEKMKTSSILVNTSRGGVIDEKALIMALKKKTIWGAGLDVTDPEPMLSNNPLLKMETVAVLPHIGSATFEARSEMSRLAAENIAAVLKGKKMPNQIQ